MRQVNRQKGRVLGSASLWLRGIAVRASQQGHRSKGIAARASQQGHRSKGSVCGQEQAGSSPMPHRVSRAKPAAPFNSPLGELSPHRLTLIPQVVRPVHPRKRSVEWLWSAVCMCHYQVVGDVLVSTTGFARQQCNPHPRTWGSSTSRHCIAATSSRGGGSYRPPVMAIPQGSAEKPYTCRLSPPPCCVRACTAWLFPFPALAAAAAAATSADPATAAAYVAAMA